VSLLWSQIALFQFDDMQVDKRRHVVTQMRTRINLVNLAHPPFLSFLCIDKHVTFALLVRIHVQAQRQWLIA